MRCVECSFSPPNILTLIHFVIPDYEKTCINPKCIKATSETNVTNVSFGPCPNDPDGQRINRCGSLSGSVKFLVPNLVGNVWLKYYIILYYTLKVYRYQ